MAKHGVKYVIVGGEAVIYYGYARLTGDLDIFYDASKDNVKSLFEALGEFWQGDIPGIENQDELLEPGVIIQFGVPPNRIDLINIIDGVTFQEVWQDKSMANMRIEHQDIPVNFIGLDELIRNKQAMRRHKDSEDLKYLTKAGKDKQD